MYGQRVGLMDADIYGPSAPRLFGLRAKPAVIGERTLVPLDGFGMLVPRVERRRILGTLFPSSLFHRTIPFRSDEERLCIAFDLLPA